MDGTAKGGVIVGLANEFRIPVHFVGVGEGIDDLQEFDSIEFIDALFGNKAD
jgi:fused signal recognition particle receptor